MVQKLNSLKIYIYIVFLLFFVNNYSQNTLKFDSIKKSPNATIHDVSWISGYWSGEAFGGLIEEIWSAPLGGSMMGSFKLVVDGKVEFYELCTISEENKTLVFRLKHFSKDLKGWEEKDECINSPLVKIEKNKVFFNNFTFEKILDNELNIYVMLKNDHGTEEEMKFNYKLKN